MRKEEGRKKEEEKRRRRRKEEEGRGMTALGLAVLPGESGPRRIPELNFALNLLLNHSVVKSVVKYERVGGLSRT